MLQKFPAISRKVWELLSRHQVKHRCAIPRLLTNVCEYGIRGREQARDSKRGKPAWIGDEVLIRNVMANSISSDPSSNGYAP
jgi:hypothetical protein